MNTHGEQDRDKLRVLWGAAAIGRKINRTPRQAYHLLEQGLIRAAKKIGGQYCADEAGLEAQFSGGEH